MSSAGQIIGGIAGATIGFFVGNPILGAQLGMMVGSAIDPPKGPSITGPRLEDLSVQTSTYGAPLPRGYGTVCVSGNIFWLENDQLKEWTTTEESGGKGGGGGGETTTYHYSATFAVGLMHVPAGATVALRRLWVDTDLIYEAGSDNVESIIASNSGHGFLAGSRIWNEISTWWINALMTGKVWTFYDGSDDQLPNDRMQADKGAANVSAYPGLCYIVFEDLSLEKYSNTLLRAQVKAELVINATTTPVVSDIASVFDGKIGDPVWGQSDDVVGFQLGSAGASYVTLHSHTYDGTPISLKFGSIEFSVQTNEIELNMVGWGWGYVDGWARITQSDEQKALAWFYQYNNQNQIKFRVITPAGKLESPNWIYDPIIIDDRIGVVAFADGDIFCAGNNSFTYITKINVYGLLAASASKYKINSLGVSENFVFALNYTPGSDNSTTTVYKFDRLTLTLVATYTQTARGGRGALHVVDDDTFYTMGRALTTGYGIVYKWVDGVVVENYGTRTTVAVDWESSLFVASGYPFYATIQPGESGTRHIYLANDAVPSTPAPLRNIVTAECSMAGIDASDLDLTSLENSDVRGFRVAQRGAVRNSLEPLQAAYPFDVAQSGYQIKFVSRGGASVASIPEEDLAATDGTPGVLLPVAREMDSQLPFRVSIRYTDPDREYDIGEQAVERYEKASLNERIMELPLSLTSGEAIQMADVLLAKEWTERVEFGQFALPPTWRHLEPSDVVTVTHRGQDYTLRLTRVEYLPDGRLVCNAKLTEAASYASSAAAQSPLVAGQSLVSLRGSSTAYLLDIPRIRSEQDVPGLCYAMTGLSTGWPGATLLRSDDFGNSYQQIGAVNARAKVFTTGAPLGAYGESLVDTGSELVATPRYAAHTLNSVTLEQFYAQANLAAYGADGRWEIIAFKTVVDNTGSYTLRDFTRGMYGSGWASGVHVAGDLLILLDTATIGFAGLPLNAVNSARLYRVVTQGFALDSAPDAEDEYEAMNLKPPAPVYLNGYRSHPSFDWVLDWEYLSKTPVEAFSGLENPVSETSETYDVVIYDATYSTPVRTIAGLTSSGCTYTIAQQQADWGGGAPVTLFLDIFQNSPLVGRGLALRTSITRQAWTNGAFYSAAVLRLAPLVYFKCDETSGNFADASGNGITGTAVATLTYNQTSLLTGGVTGKSVLGSTGRINWPYSAASDGAHTVVVIIQPSLASESCFFGTGNASGSPTDVGITYRVNTDGRIAARYACAYGSNDTFIDVTTSPVFSANEKAHIAVRWNGATLFDVFKNGVFVEQLTTYSGFPAYDCTLTRAFLAQSSGGRPFAGYADELVFFNKALTDAEIFSLYEAA